MHAGARMHRHIHAGTRMHRHLSAHTDACTHRCMHTQMCTHIQTLNAYTQMHTEKQVRKVTDTESEPNTLCILQDSKWLHSFHSCTGRRVTKMLVFLVQWHKNNTSKLKLGECAFKLSESLEQLDFNKIIFDLVNYKPVENQTPFRIHIWTGWPLPILCKAPFAHPQIIWTRTSNKVTDCVKHTTRRSVEKTCLSATVKLTAARNMAPKHAHKEKVCLPQVKKKKKSVIRLPQVKKRKQFCLNSNEWFWFHSCWRKQRGWL